MTVQITSELRNRKMVGSFIVGKSSLKKLVLSCSSKLGYIAKTTYKKIWALIRSMVFLYSEIDLYMYRSTTHPYMECFYHIWAGAPSCYLEILGKLEKRNVGFLILHVLLLLNLGSSLKYSLYICFFHKCYFSRSWNELVELFPLLYSLRRSTCYSER